MSAHRYSDGSFLIKADVLLCSTLDAVTVFLLTLLQGNTLYKENSKLLCGFTSD